MSGQATQLAIRATMAKMLEQGVSQSVVKEFAKKGLTRTALKSGAQSLALEGALGLTQSYAEKETRDTVDPNYNYTGNSLTVFVNNSTNDKKNSGYQNQAGNFLNSPL